MCWSKQYPVGILKFSFKTYVKWVSEELSKVSDLSKGQNWYLNLDLSALNTTVAFYVPKDYVSPEPVKIHMDHS